MQAACLAAAGPGVLTSLLASFLLMWYRTGQTAFQYTTPFFPHGHRGTTCFTEHAGHVLVLWSHGAGNACCSGGLFQYNHVYRYSCIFWSLPHAASDFHASISLLALRCRGDPPDALKQHIDTLSAAAKQQVASKAGTGSGPSAESGAASGTAAGRGARLPMASPLTAHLQAQRAGQQQQQQQGVPASSSGGPQALQPQAAAAQADPDMLRQMVDMVSRWHTKHARCNYRHATVILITHDTRETEVRSCSVMALSGRGVLNQQL